jgi:hypothetical protein
MKKGFLTNQSARNNNTNISHELGIYEPMTRDIAYVGAAINSRSSTICNPPTWITQLFARLYTLEENVGLLAESR